MRLVAAERGGEVIEQTLRSLVGPVGAQDGCVQCRYWVAAGERSEFLLVELWETWRDLERYIKSDRYRVVLSLMEAAAEPPEVRFDELTKTAGMELIVACRAPRNGPDRRQVADS